MSTKLWELAPSNYTQVLAKNLRKHWKTSGLPDSENTKADRLAYTEALLTKQGGTCLFGDGKNIHCWNHRRDQHCNYLKLEWGHMERPEQRIYGSRPSLALLCARCNNQLMTSRTLDELSKELTYKLNVISRLIKEEQRV